MKSRTHSPKPLSCNVVVHGNEFLATVNMFDVSPSGCHPISAGTLKPGDTIRLKITPVRGGPVTVRFAVVQWVERNEVGARIDLIYPEDERKLDEVARVSGRREARLARWLRRLLRGYEFHRVCLSYAPRLCEESAKFSQAA